MKYMESMHFKITKFSPYHLLESVDLQVTNEHSHI